MTPKENLMRALSGKTPETEQVLVSRNPSPEYAGMPPGHSAPEPVVTSVHAGHFINGPEDYRLQIF